MEAHLHIYDQNLGFKYKPRFYTPDLHIKLEKPRF